MVPPALCPGLAKNGKHKHKTEKGSFILRRKERARENWLLTFYDKGLDHYGAQEEKILEMGNDKKGANRKEKPER